MKIKRLFAFALSLLFIFSFSVTAFAENENEIYNNAFYIDLPDDLEANNFYNSDYYSFVNYENENQIFISVKENTTIDNMEEDFNVAKLIFSSFLLESVYFRENELTFTKSEVSEVNKCRVAEFEAFYESEDIYEGTTYFKVYLFANKSYTYCIIASSPESSFFWFSSAIKSFRMNGVLLDGDSQKNDIKFEGAEDYKTQLENYGDEYSNFESATSGIVFTIILISIIPFVGIFILTVYFALKYLKNKKILTQYEKTFGLLPGEMINYTNYGNIPPQNFYTQNINYSQENSGDENKK